MPGLFFISTFTSIYLPPCETWLLPFPPIMSIKLCPCQITRKLGCLEARNREVFCRIIVVARKFPELLLGSLNCSFLCVSNINVSNQRAHLSQIYLLSPRLFCAFKKLISLSVSVADVALLLANIMLTLHLQNSLWSLTSVNTVYGLQHKLGDFSQL